MKDRPNIVLFTTDQHRGDYIGLAHPIVQTPHLDSFVQRGAYFPNAYTEIPSTTGARRVLHSGQGSFACGLVGYSSKEWSPATTLAQELADAGYHCLNAGWRNMHPRRKLFGFHHAIIHDLRAGSDDYMEWLHRELGPYANERSHGVDANGWTARPWHLPEQYHPTKWTVETALQMLEKRDPTRPFFIWISHLRPHSPYDPPQAYWDMYINKDLGSAPVGDWAEKYDIPGPGLDRLAWCGRLTEEQTHRGRAGYMGTITHIDDQLGYFMEELRRRLGAADDTMILFTADHGDMMGDHHLHRKTYAYEGSARIPFVVRYPKGMDLPSGTFENVVGLQDVMPTLLDAAGVPVPDSCEGKSVLAAVSEEKWRDFIHGEHSPCYDASEAMHYLTDGKEKFIWFPIGGREMFFDLIEDRLELHNLIDDAAYGDRVALWRQRLIDRLASRGDGFSDGKQLITRDTEWSAVASENLI